MPVYFLRAGDTDAVKIGWAECVATRVRRLQEGNHLPLRVIREIPGAGRREENKLHRHFSGQQIVGEWFRYTAEMLTVEPDKTRRRQHAKMLSKRQRSPVVAAVLGRIGTVELAEELGCLPSAISQWERIPVNRVPAIERITGIPRRELRPDIYGEAA